MGSTSEPYIRLNHGGGVTFKISVLCIKNHIKLCYLSVLGKRLGACFRYMNGEHPLLGKLPG